MVKFCVLAIILSLVCGTFATLDTNHSPVLFFKNKENTKTYAKRIISSTTPVNQREFEQRFTDENQKIVFVVMDDLSPEDLSIKNEEKQRGFDNLASQVDIVEYMPYVQNAAANKVTSGPNVIRSTLTTTNELEPQPNSDARIIIVSLPECDDTEPRFHCIARIDRACYALSQSDEYKDALFVLTSKMNSKLQEAHSRRVARDTTAQAPPKGNVFKSTNSLVYFANLMESPKKGTDVIIPVTEVIPTKLSDNEISLEFKSKYNIIMYFQLDEANYWALNASKSKINDKPVDIQTDVPVPQEFSFSCSSFTIAKYKEGDIESIFFQNLQIQLNFTTGSPMLTQFADSYDCVGFTSPAIWSGLFITLLLISIVGMGITYIMDIRTMDRFDDPKGKTITVIASE